MHNVLDLVKYLVFMMAAIVLFDYIKYEILLVSQKTMTGRETNIVCTYRCYSQNNISATLKPK